MGWYDSGASSLAGMAQIAQNYKAEPNAGASIAGGIDTAVQKIKGRAEEIRLNDLRVASEGRVKDLLAQPPKAGENPTQWLSQVAEAGSYLDPQKKAALDKTIKGYTMQYETDTKKLLQQEGFTHAEKMQQEQIASAEKLATERNALTKEQIQATRENQKAMLGLQEKQNEFNQALKIAELNKGGYNVENKGGKFDITSDPTSPAYQLTQIREADKNIQDDFKKITPESFKKVSDDTQLLGGLFTSNKSQYDALGKAETIINMPSQSKTDVELKMKLLGLVKAGNHEGINALLNQ